MSKVLKNTLLLCAALSFFSCGGAAQEKSDTHKSTEEELSEEDRVEMRAVKSETITVGAERLSAYLPLLKDRRVAVVANTTSLVGHTHLVDTLLSSGVAVKKVFAPEHGFRGTADAGEKVLDERDMRTGLPIISLYTKSRKPTADILADVDLVVFDIQDVGVRTYTYISTLHNVMEACAENGIGIMVLDRPDPNGFYIDGPMLEKGFESFVGMHPVPLVHGMTTGEYAQMIIGEGWIGSNEKCDLTVIPCEGYTHGSTYELPVRPSPNLPNQSSIYLYPSLVLFEGTAVSIGRGTDTPFQVVGHPDFTPGDYTFTPRPNEGAKHPKLEGQTCKGIDLRSFGEFYSRQSHQMSLTWLIEFYQQSADKDSFFLENGFFNTLAGTDKLREQIESGLTEEQIRASWQDDLKEYDAMREEYLLYE